MGKFYPLNQIPFWLATLAVGFVGFSVFGAYKTSTGAFAVDIGGKKMKATCSALMGFSSNGAAAAIIVCKGFLGIVCAGAIYRDDLQKIDVPAARELEQPLNA